MTFWQESRVTYCDHQKLYPIYTLDHKNTLQRKKTVNKLQALVVWLVVYVQRTALQKKFDQRKRRKRKSKKMNEWTCSHLLFLLLTQQEIVFVIVMMLVSAVIDLKLRMSSIKVDRMSFPRYKPKPLVKGDLYCYKGDFGKIQTVTVFIFGGKLTNCSNSKAFLDTTLAVSGSSADRKLLKYWGPYME